jgi:hypothetical protein
MESLSFSDTSSISNIQSNIGGPPLPYNLSDSLLTTTNDNLTNQQKHQAYLNYVNNNGYALFDYTKITDNNMKAATIIVNNTSFFVFFSLFIIFFILIISLIVYGYLDFMLGIYLILIFSILIFIISVIYRQNTLSYIQSSINVLNSDIVQNKAEYEQSIIQLPNNVVTVSQSINSSFSSY